MAHVIDDAGGSHNGNDTPDELRWWLPESQLHGDKRHHVLGQVVDRLETEDAQRRSAFCHHLRLYGGRRAAAALLDPGDVIDQSGPSGSAHLKHNVCQSVVSTGVSRLGKNKPRPQYLSNGGDFGLMQQSRRLSHFVSGIFDRAKVYSKGRRAFRDAAVMGPGVLTFFPEKTPHGWSIGCDRVFPWEILVDGIDGLYGEPRAQYRVRHIDKRVLYERYADTERWKGRRAELRAALDASDRGQRSSTRRATVNYTVKVVEGHRLPSAPGAGDGLHVIATSEAVLYEEEWDESWCPHVVYNFQPPISGFWGTGLVEVVDGIQVHINRLLWAKERAIRLLAMPMLAVHRGSKIEERHLTNGIGTTIKHSGTPPQLLAFDPTGAFIERDIQQQIQLAHDLSGVSQLAASQRKPADLESGEALRQFNAIEDARHADPALNYEMFYMDCAKVITGLARRMAKDGREPVALATFKRSTRTWVEPIKWKDVAVAEDAVLLRVYPTSNLPSVPAGRTATVQEWFRSGLVDRVTAMILLEIPDTEGVPREEVVQYEAIADDIESIIDKGVYRPPTPYTDLRLSRSLATSAYLRFRRMKGVEADRLEMLNRYLKTVDFLEERAAAAGQGGAPGPAPGPVPGGPEAGGSPIGAGGLAAALQSLPPGGVPAGGPEVIAQAAT